MPEQVDVRAEVAIGTEQRGEPVPVAAFGIEIGLVVVDIGEVPVVGKGSIVDNVVDMDCNQDIADSIVDTVVAVDTIALQ